MTLTCDGGWGPYSTCSRSRDVVPLHHKGMPAQRKDGSPENVNCTEDWQNAASYERSRKWGQVEGSGSGFRRRQAAMWFERVQKSQSRYW